MNEINEIDKLWLDLGKLEEEVERTTVEIQALLLAAKYKRQCSDQLKGLVGKWITEKKKMPVSITNVDRLI
jgi:hypothetical protein